MGRPVLQFISRHEKKMLDVACERNGADVDDKDSQKWEGIEENSDRAMAAVFEEDYYFYYMLLDRVSTEDNGTIDNCSCAEIGCDT